MIKKLKIDCPWQPTHSDDEKIINKINELVEKVNHLTDRLEEIEGPLVRGGLFDD